MQNPLHIGTLKKPHGIKGAICFFSKTQPEELVFSLDLYTKDGEPFVIRDYALHHQKMICFSDQISDRTAAESWQGSKLYCDRDTFFSQYPDQIFEDLCQDYVILAKDGTVLGILQYVSIIQGIPMLIIEQDKTKLNLAMKTINIDHSKQTLQLNYNIDDC